MNKEAVLSLPIAGDRLSGKDVRSQNVTAVMAIANIVKSALGPTGLDKMLVDDIGDVTISNDGATILSLLEVEHPAAKILVELAHNQDREVGDGTTTVVILAAELLKRGNELAKSGVHPTTVITGFRLAMKEAVRYISENLSIKVDSLGRECLINCAKTSISSKIIGAYDEFFANIIVDAVLAVKTVSGNGEVKYPISAINVLKAHGSSIQGSELIKGYALNCTVASQGMKKRIASGSVKIACLDMNLQKTKMSLGVHVVIDDPEQLENIRKRELDITTEKIQKILASGANVILTTKGIDDMSLKLFVEAGAMAVRRVKKEDLKRIAKATGATIVSSLASLEGGDESFESGYLGTCEEVTQTRISDDECLLFLGTKAHSSASVILRGANDIMLEEMDRSLHDALCVVKRTLESNSVVPGGGAVEAALSIFLDNFATSLSSREQIAVAEFANSLLVIPKTLANNAALDSVDLVAKLRAFHNASQISANDPVKKELKFYGLDLLSAGRIDSPVASSGEPCLRNNLKAGVLEPSMIKTKAIKSATEAAISILRIDDLIKVTPEQKEQVGNPHDGLD